MTETTSTQTHAAVLLNGLYLAADDTVGVINGVVHLGREDYVIIRWEDGEVTLDSSIQCESIFATRERALASLQKDKQAAE